MLFIYFSGQRKPWPSSTWIQNRIRFIRTNWLTSLVQLHAVDPSHKSPAPNLDPQNNQISYNQNNRQEAKMQKREQSKSGGAVGGAATPAAKRGRPFGSTSGSSGGAGSGADSAAPTTLLGPSLQVHSSFAGQLLKP